jgi:hypothetical protein
VQQQLFNSASHVEAASVLHRLAAGHLTTSVCKQCTQHPLSAACTCLSVYLYQHTLACLQALANKTHLIHTVGWAHLLQLAPRLALPVKSGSAES